jgi:hypothetical protein
MTVCDIGCKRSHLQKERRGGEKTRKTRGIWVSRRCNLWPKKMPSGFLIFPQVKNHSTPLFKKRPNHVTEIQNHIYGYAAEYSYRHWSYLSRPASEREVVTGDRKGHVTLPYMALTHTCCKIRLDFRPMWLSIHQIPFEVMPSYLRAFFPHYSPRKRRSARPKSSFAVAKTGRLRVWARVGKINFRNFIRLLRHRVQYPKHTIKCHTSTSTDSSALQWLEQIINNTNPVWMQWIKANKIQKVEVGGNSYGSWSASKTLHISIKPSYEESWMSTPNTSPGYLDHLERLGLPSGGSVSFRVVTRNGRGP